MISGSAEPVSALALPLHWRILGRFWSAGYRLFCGLVFFFLVVPVLVIIPLSFNAEPFFTFTSGMLHFRAAAYSLHWYRDTFANPQWTLAIRNSIIIACSATVPATILGTLAALGLSQQVMPWRSQFMAVLISPMIVPVIITASGLYFFYADIGLTQSFTGIILAHAVLGSPFVVLTVTATLAGFDRNLTRAAASLGANPFTSFFKVTMPMILPGILSGAVFAFITSFDETVVVLFLAGYQQRTIPRQMWAGIRDQISPTILAVATMLIGVSVLLMATIELLRRRSRRFNRRPAAAV